MSGKQVTISVIICTRNRSPLLSLSVLAILPQLSEQVELIIIDNGSTDITGQVVAEFRKYHPDKVAYHFLPSSGLSRARNLAVEVANGSWLLYVDDDMLCEGDLIQKLKELVNQNLDKSTGVVGGAYTALWLQQRPDWISSDWGQLVFESELKTLKKPRFAHGCLMAVRKEIIAKVGNFRTDLGMDGKNVAWSEEEDFQNRVRAEGFLVCGTSLLRGRHIVGEHKYHFKWHFAKIFSIHRDKVRSFGYDSDVSIVQVFIQIVKLPIRLLLAIPRIFIDDYHLNTYILDGFRPLLQVCGEYWGQRSNKID